LPINEASAPRDDTERNAQRLPRPPTDARRRPQRPV